MNYELIALIVVAVLGVIFSGKFWLNLKHLIMQTAEFMDVLSGALDDDKIDNDEIAKILKEAGDVGKAAVGIVALFNKK